MVVNQDTMTLSTVNKVQYDLISMMIHEREKWSDIHNLYDIVTLWTLLKQLQMNDNDTNLYKHDGVPGLLQGKGCILWIPWEQVFGIFFFSLSI